MIFLLLWLIVEVALIVLFAKKMGIVVCLLALVIAIFIGKDILLRENRHYRDILMYSPEQIRGMGKQVGESFLRVVAALLLIIPGFVSDIVAIVLLIRPLRALVGWSLIRFLRVEEIAQRFYRHSSTGNVYEHDANAVYPRDENDNQQQQSTGRLEKNEH